MLSSFEVHMGIQHAYTSVYLQDYYCLIRLYKVKLTASSYIPITNKINSGDANPC